jgi:hypothetical protein
VTFHAGQIAVFMTYAALIGFGLGLILGLRLKR